MNSLTKVQDPFLNFNDMEHFFQNWNDNFHRNGVRHIPAINVSKTKDGYELECAAPGLEKKDFKIDLDGSLITISATKKNESKEENKHYSKREYNYSSFSRSFNLLETIDKDKISAKYENGILKLSLPKKADAAKLEHKIIIE
ncbi:Hsp20/alpha crystallin family protein [Leptospira noguchii]|uniref:Hsp20/alpha crystallin family protein n=1 Tax=Leptospira noguchii serovar Autumnalis str. ZUN142 TaxID=1085540 RepID=M6UCC1_9LEPT|nr:Hsp20/alpha crystallin family protein [Leptospira noguchii]EKR72119.1 Hsp20/alpha crystallin family protein [Leptospira noguchii str. 2006001870]EMO42697.1 Hsp20/alpha crystallin family protein [Leptospira noguchii serovar Autumnalis str. ZUN142]EMS88723.1 Hsp20/alpha crystallin family protein [Leptospira noguchii str. Hook]UOG50642.1 Hsp20/alpha crystallin family protein [Leptospira noguchii]UOG62379.1 Hsp20/alpha crystallin family protein [Leptospira noguchii]